MLYAVVPIASRQLTKGFQFLSTPKQLVTLKQQQLYFTLVVMEWMFPFMETGHNIHRTHYKFLSIGLPILNALQPLLGKGKNLENLGKMESG